MKIKHFILSISIALSSLLCLTAQGCMSSDKYDAVAEKISSRRTLTQDDYSAMIDYCGEFALKAQKIQDAINNSAGDGRDTGDDTKRLERLRERYPLLRLFSPLVASCTAHQAGPVNVAKINSLATLSWFTAPDWAIENAMTTAAATGHPELYDSLPDSTRDSSPVY